MSTLYTPFSKTLFTYMGGEHPPARPPWGGLPLLGAGELEGARGREAEGGRV